MADPLMVPVTVAVPGAVDEVSVAEYVPSPLSVTGPSRPRVVGRLTVAPPVIRSFP